MPFLLDTLEDLEKCAVDCKHSHEEVLKKLTESQRVEFERLIAFFRATQRWYERVLDRSFEEDRKLNKKATLNIVLGLAILGIVWFLFGSDSLELKFGGIVFALVLGWGELESKLVDYRSKVESLKE